MAKLRLVLLTLMALLIITPNAWVVPQLGPKTGQTITNNLVTRQAKTPDVRAKILTDYLTKHNSPFKDHAADFIEAADKEEIDWKLVPAIAGVESTFGQFVPGGNKENSSYNAWGWGVYGDQAIYFKSWRDGIFTVSQGLKERYISKGLTNPFSINKVYAASPTWGAKVSYFLADIDQYSKNYKVAKQPVDPQLPIPFQNPDIFPANQPIQNQIGQIMVKSKGDLTSSGNNSGQISLLVN